MATNMAQTDSEFAAQIASLDPDEVAQAVDFVLYRGGSFAFLKGITFDELEAVYAVAYSQFSQHDYEKAEKLFAFLCMFDHREQKHWMGLGAARQNLKDFLGATAAYAMASMLEYDDPLPCLQAGECWLASGELAKAEGAFKSAVHYASQDDKHEKVRMRAEAMLTATRHRIEREGT